MKQRCSICRQDISPDCTWNQGRCPHLPSLAETIIQDPYKARFSNLFNSIKNLFTKDDCNCGHKH